MLLAGGGSEELTRRHTCAAILTVEQGRKTIADGLGYPLLATDDPDDVAHAIEFGRHIARVASAELRTQLENFSAMCAEYSPPPIIGGTSTANSRSACSRHGRSFGSQEGAGVASLIGEHLRREVDRQSNSPARQD